MRVIIPDSHFIHDRHSARELSELLGFAFEGRHIVVVEPEFGPDSSPHACAWLEQRGRSERDELILALNDSLAEETKRKRRLRTVHICDESWRVASDTIFCTLKEARILLSRPLKILVENAYNDGAFVRRMLPPSWRQKLERFEQASWAEFENGGGLGTLKEIIEHREAPLAVRTVAIFDSDARCPGSPSHESDLAVQACEDKQIECVRLKRRASENYIPSHSLRLWSETDELQHKQRARMFARLTQEQRHHYAMREGLQKDMKGEELPELFVSLTKREREVLMQGFGDIRDFFTKEEHLPEHALEADDVHAEREHLRALIFGNI